MKSYEVARKFFSFFEVVGWIGVGLGVLVGVAVAEKAGASGLIFGAVLSIASLFSIVILQVGRATVDTAEYSQQMLKIMRDQQVRSRHGLAMHADPASTPVAHDAPGTKAGHDADVGLEGIAETYKGVDIRYSKKETGYFVGSGLDKKNFASIERARAYVDRESGDAGKRDG